MENNYPKDPVEEGKPPLDLEDDLYDDDPYEGLDDICGEEDAEDNFQENMRFYDPMDDDDDDYDSFEELERLGLY